MATGLTGESSIHSYTILYKTDVGLTKDVSVTDGVCLMNGVFFFNDGVYVYLMNGF